MTGRIEKTVFISYRRTNGIWARAIYQDLYAHGFDAFFDFQSIDSGDFSQVILENIKARAHFIILLTPSALERCEEPNDWLRQEIETAIDTKRNIVPLMLDGFDFGSPDILRALTDKLALLKVYNGLRIYSEYFEEGMARLRERYLNIALDAVLHPVSHSVKEATRVQQKKAKETESVKPRELAAHEWNEKGALHGRQGEHEEALRYFTEAINLNPSYDMAFSNRSLARKFIGDIDGAIDDITHAINLDPINPDYYINRGSAFKDKGDFDSALVNYDHAIKLDPEESAGAFQMIGVLALLRGDLEKALSNIQQAIKINPRNGSYRISLINVLRRLNRISEAEAEEPQAMILLSNDAEYNRACFEAVCGDKEKALDLLQIAIVRHQANLQWIKLDPDLDNIREESRFIAMIDK